MPMFDLWLASSDMPKYMVEGNNEDECIGRARERYHLPDTIALYATLVEEDSRAGMVITLSDLIHSTGLTAYRSYSVVKAEDHMIASGLESIFQLLNRAYVASIQLANNVDVDARRKKKIALDAHTTRQRKR